MLEELLAGITSTRDELPTSVLTGRRPRIVLKVAPDLSEGELRDIAEAVQSTKGVDGVIVSNTTIQRPKSLVDGKQPLNNTGLISYILLTTAC